MTRSTKAILALTTFLVTSFVSAHSNSNPLAAIAERSTHDLVERDSFPELLKRTHGDVYMCSDDSLKLTHSDNGCGCKSSVGKKDKECKPPKNHRCGVAKCSHNGGCHVECNAGMQLNKKGDDCECLPGYTLSKSGTYCKPECDDNEKWNGSECVCIPGCGKNKNKHKCEPECDKHEEWNGQKCVCKDGYHLKNGKCKPKCDKHEHEEWNGHKCVCKDGYHLKNDKCKPKCDDREVWTGNHCMCKPGYIRQNDKCHPRCDKNEIWTGDHCVCIPGCHRGHDDKCNPGPSQLPHHPGHGNGHGNGHGHGHGNGNGHGHGHGHGHHKREAPVWSSKLHTRDQDSLFCPDGLSACPIDSTLGGYECVDTKQELENCGGCTANGSGKDCTTITGAAGVGCHAGQCIVLSCVETHRLSANGDCIPYLTSQKHKRHSSSSA